MSRAERLNTRFKTIQRTLEELYGRERAFGAASAAWFMAIQYLHKQSLLRILRERTGGEIDPQDTIRSAVTQLENEMQTMLQGFHAELCEHLKVDQADAWHLAKSFKQVIDDVCHQGG